MYFWYSCRNSEKAIVILMINMLKKVFKWSEVHLSEMTCYKIHTLTFLIFRLMCGNHVIWTGCWMTNLVLNFECLLWFSFQPTSKSDLRDQIWKKYKLLLKKGCLNSKEIILVSWRSPKFQNLALDEINNKNKYSTFKPILTFNVQRT